MRWFSIKRTVKLGTNSLWLHRLRSALTTLGIVFDVCSVIAILAIGEGTSQAMQEVIARLDSTNLIIDKVDRMLERLDKMDATKAKELRQLRQSDPEKFKTELMKTMQSMRERMGMQGGNRQGLGRNRDAKGGRNR